MTKILTGALMLLSAGAAWAQDYREMAFKTAFATQEHIDKHLPGSPATLNSVADLIVSLSQTRSVTKADYEQIVEKCREHITKAARHYYAQRIEHFLIGGKLTGAQLLVRDGVLQPGTTIEIEFATINGTHRTVVSGVPMLNLVVMRGWGAWRGDGRTGRRVELNDLGLAHLEDVEWLGAPSAQTWLDTTERLQKYTQDLFLKHTDAVAASWKSSK
jgi:hypothetical protein